VHVVIAGCGRVGSGMAHDLVREGHDVVVIDDDPRSFALLGPRFPGERVIGQAIDWSILKSAGIEGTDAFAAATDGDNSNIVCALIALRAFEVPCVVARVYDPRRAEVFRRMGIRTVCPTVDTETSLLEAVLSCPADPGKA
jgi:trk system potassium uptake protein TrkA